MMGQYLIPNATLPREAADWLEASGRVVEGQTWDLVDGGVLFTDPSRTDAQCATAYAGFVPGNGEAYRTPVPQVILDHLPHIRDYLAASPTAVTPAQTAHVVQDIIRVLNFLNQRLETG